LRLSSDAIKSAQLLLKVLSSAPTLRACEEGYSARYFRAPRLLHDLDIGRADGTYKNKLSALNHVDLIVLDDWLIAPLHDAHRRDLLEILDDRYDAKTTLIASQLPVELWHEAIADPTLADAILDSSTTPTGSISKETPLETKPVSSTSQRAPRKRLWKTLAKCPLIPPLVSAYSATRWPLS